MLKSRQMQVGRGSGDTPIPGRRRRMLIAVVAAMAIIAGGYFQFVAQINKKQPEVNKPKLLRAGSDAGYIDSATCTGCHRELWETYRHTGMGRSISRPSREAMV